MKKGFVTVNFDVIHTVDDLNINIHFQNRDH